MTKHYIGIDPGSSSGCIAIISRVDGVDMKSTIEFGKHTTKEWYYELLSVSDDDCVAVLEKVHGMPKSNVVAVSSFMRNVGNIEMALIALDIPFTEVTPQTWMKYYGMKKEKDESKPDWKRRLREHLQRIMPDFKVNNNNADAMLIANYCKEIHG